MVRREDYLDWMKHPVTEAFLEYLNTEVNDKTWSLIQDTGRNPVEDARLSGAINTIGSIMTWKPALSDELPTPQEEDED